MSLKQQIDAYEVQKKQNVPADILQLMDTATADLLATGIENQALKAGATSPEFSLPNHLGEQVSLTELLKSGPVVLVFYRGGWCPYCNLELQALQEKLSEIHSAGAQLVAVSPQTPDNSLDTAKKNALEFQVLSDEDNTVARQFGLVFTLDQRLQPIYDKFGLDINAANGNDRKELPLPATYIIQPDKTISLAFAKADYTARLEPEDIVSALRG